MVTILSRNGIANTINSRFIYLSAFVVILEPREFSHTRFIELAGAIYRQCHCRGGKDRPSTQHGRQELERIKGISTLGNADKRDVDDMARKSIGLCNGTLTVLGCGFVHYDLIEQTSVPGDA